MRPPSTRHAAITRVSHAVKKDPVKRIRARKPHTMLRTVLEQLAEDGAFVPALLLDPLVLCGGRVPHVDGGMAARERELLTWMQQADRQG